MHRNFYLAAILAATSGMSTTALAQSAARANVTALSTAVAAPTRTPANVARDKYRNPVQTLSFFGVKPNHIVVELIPGGGWYTEILAPYLAKSGQLYAAQSPGRAMEALKTKLAGNAVYARVKLVPLLDPAIPAGTVDTVLTFRNMHNLVMRGDGSEAKLLAQVFTMLKPGGTLGIVDHRLPEARDISAEKTSGYLKTSTVRRVVEAAGFQFVGSSEVNANPRDTADYPKGVWTLPPNYAEKDVDRAKYAAIGESDRMTLKFIKPKK